MDVGLVCDSCSTFNPMGATSCSRCRDALSLDAHEAGAVAVDVSARARPGSTPFGDEPTVAGPGVATLPPATTACPTCNARVAVGHRFCGHCGGRMPADGNVTTGDRHAPVAPETLPQTGSPRSTKRTMFFGAMQAARAKLVLIRGDGHDGVSFTLAGQEHIAGRVNAPLLFEDDPFISPTHANFFYREGELVVSDEDSVNGIFIRIRGAVPIASGDRFLIGEQLLQVQSPDEVDPDPTHDGTYFFASPRRPAHFYIVQGLRGGGAGLAYRAQQPIVGIGREGNDINFPDDPFISGHHARISYDRDQPSLIDLDSKNGTFLRINREQVLRHGDYVFMGQQLLRVEIV